MHMPQFTTPRPALQRKAACRALAPRNPYAAACWQRQAGAHQAPDRRQAAQRQIKADLRELWHPPSSD
jgi:hypothetical protein